MVRQLLVGCKKFSTPATRSPTWTLQNVTEIFLTLLSLAIADRSPEYPVRRGVTFAPARGVQMILQEKL
ncbi:MAG: hypothetical protein N4J56_004358 [Chroococcidiopsis sp. SAG 2025]|uniref:hypothetical protein n=1 Tax=Chroococcidiopsis sp. SAG 2025 TaxID=171389 RepID=UPI0029373D71|nr:hypothetical protein [Chroococcidiopsis sp. SAG 2025]MDV2994704.1 hypothetical protein [Chroococcidiopsis sp. SAG 2025]